MVGFDTVRVNPTGGEGWRRAFNALKTLAGFSLDPPRPSKSVRTGPAV